MYRESWGGFLLNLLNQFPLSIAKTRKFVLSRLIGRWKRGVWLFAVFLEDLLKRQWRGNSK
jgi:hypothetical protein